MYITKKKSYLKNEGVVHGSTLKLAVPTCSCYAKDIFFFWSWIHEFSDITYTCRTCSSKGGGVGREGGSILLRIAVILIQLYMFISS